MSDMKLQAAVRFKHSSGHTAREISLDFLESVLDTPDEMDCFDEEARTLEGFNYEPSKHGGWTLHRIGDDLYLTKMLEEEYAASDVDVSVTSETLAEIVEEARGRFFYGGEVPPYTVRVLYQYTGGCAGLSEIV